MLCVISGLPGAGKSTVAKRLARIRGATYLRADTIEQALVESGFTPEQIGGAGYQVAARTARENLRLGNDVIVDCVNPWALTREIWREAANDAGAEILEVEIVCGDLDEHRRRVETREVDVPGLRMPTWHEVVERDYREWDAAPLRIDTAVVSAEDAARQIAEAWAASNCRGTRED